jgi:nitrogen fixation NifU-like protein
VKIHCSILAEDAIKAAVADFRSRHPVGAATLVSEQPACASSTR